MKLKLISIAIAVATLTAPSVALSMPVPLDVEEGSVLKIQLVKDARGDVQLQPTYYPICTEMTDREITDTWDVYDKETNTCTIASKGILYQGNIKLVPAEFDYDNDGIADEIAIWRWDSNNWEIVYDNDQLDNPQTATH